MSQALLSEIQQHVISNSTCNSILFALEAYLLVSLIFGVNLHLASTKAISYSRSWGTAQLIERKLGGAFTKITLGGELEKTHDR